MLSFSQSTPAGGSLDLGTDEGALRVAFTGSLDKGDGDPAIYFARAIVGAHRGSLELTRDEAHATVIRVTF